MRANEVLLYKALIFELQKVNLPKYDRFYVDEIGAYVFVWEYVYNTTTYRGASSANNHKDVRKRLPPEILAGEQYDLMLDVDLSGKYLHDRYGTPEHIRNYVVTRFNKDGVNVFDLQEL